MCFLWVTTHWFGNSRSRITRKDLCLSVLESRKWDNSVHDELLLREDMHRLSSFSVGFWQSVLFFLDLQTDHPDLCLDVHMVLPGPSLSPNFFF